MKCPLTKFFWSRQLPIPEIQERVLVTPLELAARNIYLLNLGTHCIEYYVSMSEWGITITLPILRLLSSRAQGCKGFRKPCKSCHVGIHWIALNEFAQMSTHVAGFQSFYMPIALFCIGQISHHQHKG